jgi:HAMP domain-containing protein
MALTTHLDSWNDKVVTAKEDFTPYLDGMQAIGGPGVQAAVERMREIDVRYAAAGAEVVALYEAGDLSAALDLHISAEHEISHELEDELNALIASTEERIDVALGELSSLHRFLLFAVGIFSGVSLLIALGLGAALSWSVIRPVRKVDLALARIADGDFGQQVEVPNRDEFGRLTTNLNWTSEQLAKLYRDLADLTELEEGLGGAARQAPSRRGVAPVPRAAGRRRRPQRRRTRLAHLHSAQPQHPRREDPRVQLDVRGHGA